MKYFLIAGEASGDIHAADWIRAIKQADADAEFACWGGDEMQQASGKALLRHYRHYSVMGFWEVIKNLRNLSATMRLCKQQVLQFQPDVLLLIDFPGFNLRMARFAKKQGIRVAYYIAPKVWAWKESRIHTLKANTDLLLLILPFEQSYFERKKVQATYVGNPSAEQVRRYRVQHGPTQAATSKQIALLPGSRKQEIEKMLPLMCNLAARYPQYHFVVAGAPSLTPEHYQPYVSANLQVVFGKTYSILHHSHAAIVCSGTATLETALFGVPQVCGYKANALSYFIAKRIVNIPYISLVNLCLNELLIEELIQDRWNEAELVRAFEHIISPEGRQTQLQGYARLTQLLASREASQEAAAALMHMLRA